MRKGENPSLRKGFLEIWEDQKKKKRKKNRLLEFVVNVMEKNQPMEKHFALFVMEQEN